MKHPARNQIPTLFPENMKAYEFRSPDSIMNKLQVIVTVDAARWEHVSVKGVDQFGNTYTPSWNEMCFVKDHFFDEEEVVIQIHPKKSQYVNLHPHVLHLWRDIVDPFSPPFR